MRDYEKLFQPERENLEHEIALQKNLVTFHTELKNMHEKKLQDKQLKLEELDHAMEEMRKWAEANRLSKPSTKTEWSPNPQ